MHSGQALSPLSQTALVSIFLVFSNTQNVTFWMFFYGFSYVAREDLNLLEDPREAVEVTCTKLRPKATFCLYSIYRDQD